MSHTIRDFVTIVDRIKSGRAACSERAREQLREELRLMNPARDLTELTDQELAEAWWNDMLAGGWDIVWP